MGVVIKNSQFGVLKKLGLSDSLIGMLSKAGVKLAMSQKEITLYGQGKSTTVAFSSPVAALASGAANILPTEIQSLAAAIAEILGDTCTPVVAAAPAAVAAPKADPSVGKQPIVPLKDSTAVYQRVRGTSGDSVYVTVAMGSGVKVAARFHSGNRVSMRVEGELNNAVRAAFAAQGFQIGKGGEYMSMHTMCVHVPPERVIGAVLMGTGLAFDSPLPSMATIKALSK